MGVSRKELHLGKICEFDGILFVDVGHIWKVICLGKDKKVE
jgi:hypothetical protein